MDEICVLFDKIFIVLGELLQKNTLHLLKNMQSYINVVYYILLQSKKKCLVKYALGFIANKQKKCVPFLEKYALHYKTHCKKYY